MEARDPAELALDAITRRILPIVFLGVGAFYLAVALVAPLLPTTAAAPGAGQLARWFGTAAIGAIGGWAFHRWPAPTGWSNSIAGALGALTVLNSLSLVDALGPSFLFALVVALVGFALFLLSLPWVVGLCVLGLAGWTALAQQAGWGPEWTPRTFNLVAFCVVAIVAQATRVGLHRRLAVLKQRDLDRVAKEGELARERALDEQRRRIVRMTAHELATPLTPVLLQASVLARSGLDDEQRRNLEVLQRNLARLKQTIERVVEAAKAEEADEASRAGGTGGAGEAGRAASRLYEDSGRDHPDPVPRDRGGA